MDTRGRDKRLRRGELDVALLHFTKAELAATPKEHRSFYLVLGQLTNEVAMLQSLLVRAIQGIKGPRPVQETSLGMALFLTRLICGRIYEAHGLINSRENGALLTKLWTNLPKTPEAQRIRDEAVAARVRLNKELGPSSSLFRLVRNKLAHHLEQELLESTFERMSEDIELADFHTGMRGTTFFGVADTVAALAVAEASPQQDMFDAVRDMAAKACRAVGDLQDFSDGFLLAFYLTHFGEDRIASSERVRLRALPELETASLGFFLSSRSRRPRLC